MRRLFRVVPVVLVALSVLALVLPRGAETVPLYAARNGLMCETCHFDPNGGGPRNDFGFMFARNRHDVTPEPEGSPFAGLELVNKVGDTLPLYVGVNQRFMLLGNATTESDSLDRLGFFNMENALHLTLQPHDKLSLVYTRDGFNRESRSGEAFGLIRGFPWNGYLKAGRVRTPFGLRMDDHTVATRNGFLDFASAERFLPYDPREPDMGVEIGGEKSGWFGRAAWLNGGANPFGGLATRSHALVGKLGYHHANYQGGLSLYNDVRTISVPVTVDDEVRLQQARWGYYGMTHWKQFALLGEVAAGTDRLPNGLGDHTERNVLAWWAELDYHPVRQWNVRVRMDQMVTDRSTDEATRDAATHSRLALETEWVPVPFAELRWTLRQIDHKDEEAYGFEDETQAYMQFHFSY